MDIGEIKTGFHEIHLKVLTKCKSNEEEPENPALSQGNDQMSQEINSYELSQTQDIPVSQNLAIETDIPISQQLTQTQLTQSLEPTQKITQPEEPQLIPIPSPLKPNPKPQLNCQCGLETKAFEIHQCSSCTNYSHQTCTGHLSATSFRCHECIGKSDPFVSWKRLVLHTIKQTPSICNSPRKLSMAIGLDVENITLLIQWLKDDGYITKRRGKWVPCFTDSQYHDWFNGKVEGMDIVMDDKENQVPKNKRKPDDEVEVEFFN